LIYIFFKQIVDVKKRLRIIYLLTLKEVRNFKFQKKYLIFLFFLFLSTVFWFLNALDKEYTSYIQVPMEFVNVSENKTFTYGQNYTGELLVKINSRGFRIFEYNSTIFRNSIKIKSDSKYVKRLKNDSLTLLLQTYKLKNLVSGHLGEDFKILTIEPDSIIFYYENTVSKKVPIKPNLKLKFKQQFYQTAPEIITPDSIFVSGRKNLIDAIDFVATEEYEFTGVEQNLNISCELRPQKGLKYQKKQVKVLVPVEEFTEKTMNIPIEVVNLPPNYELQLFPQFAYIQFNISTSNYLKVKPEDFRFTVDYKDIKENTKTLRINMENYSVFAFNLKFSPKKVEYLLEK